MSGIANVLPRRIYRPAVCQGGHTAIYYGEGEGGGGEEKKKRTSLYLRSCISNNRQLSPRTLRPQEERRSLHTYLTVKDGGHASPRNSRVASLILNGTDGKRKAPCRFLETAASCLGILSNGASSFARGSCPSLSSSVFSFPLYYNFSPDTKTRADVDVTSWPMP